MSEFIPNTRKAPDGRMTLNTKSKIKRLEGTVQLLLLW
jgi:hypothetical protein